VVASTAEPFNGSFATELEARLGWAMYNLARFGLGRPIPPFPGDQPPAPKNSPRSGSDIFDALRQEDLSEFASRFTALRQTGPGRWKGRCPLHEERTGSFVVYADPWRWHCFGACGEGGDIVRLARSLQLRGRW
jgi:hypothetical protein